MIQKHDLKSSESQELKDFEVIEKIQKKEKNIEDLDNETKVRIIKLLANRSNEIQKKINLLKNKNKSINKQLLNNK